MTPQVAALSLSPTHSFSKQPALSLRLLTGLGVEGDAHCAATTQHRYLLRKDPTRANLTQVHLIPTELFASLAPLGIHLQPGQMGENITTTGLDLHALPTGTLLRVGPHAILEVTGIRDPCGQLNTLHPGLMEALTLATPEGRKSARAGIMSTVHTGGLIHPGDAIQVELPPKPHRPLQFV